MDFLVTMLTENDTVVMSAHNAASWGYYDTVKKSWNVQVRKMGSFAPKQCRYM
jgi:hypothetical protein